MISGVSATNSITAVGTIFKNLRGNWSFIREIKSKLSSSPSGTVIGHAQFAKVTDNDNQHLYSEEGKFKIDNGGAVLDVSRKYLYEYDDKSDSIQVFFATNQATKDKFFHTISLKGEDMTAIGDHLCEADQYTANYSFPAQASNTFNIQFTVKGPQKDYIAFTTFTRDKTAG